MAPTGIFILSWIGKPHITVGIQWQPCHNHLNQRTGLNYNEHNRITANNDDVYRNLLPNECPTLKLCLVLLGVLDPSHTPNICRCGWWGETVQDALRSFGPCKRLRKPRNVNIHTTGADVLYD